MVWCPGRCRSAGISFSNPFFRSFSAGASSDACVDICPDRRHVSSTHRPFGSISIAINASRCPVPGRLTNPNWWVLPWRDKRGRLIPFPIDIDPDTGLVDLGLIERLGGAAPAGSGLGVFRRLTTSVIVDRRQQRPFVVHLPLRSAIFRYSQHLRVLPRTRAPTSLAG